MVTRTEIKLLVTIVILFLSGCVSDMWSHVGAEGNNRIMGSAVAREQIVLPHNIAILLPLKSKGEFAGTSQAIYNGFLAAYYTRKQQSDVNIKVVDISTGDIAVLYQQAVSDGAEVIVGPLTKHDVEAIANLGSLPVPTIALNTLDDYKRNVVTNLYQFGLLPQDEAQQVATQMAQEQLNNTAVMVPEGIWGDKIVTAFISEYESSGRRVVANLRYRFGADLASQICNFLAQDAANLCVPKRHRNKKQNNSHEIMRRQDIDAIFFVAATPAQARQIVPLLKFYYANDLPIYSISTVYGGVSRPYLDQDINDVYFCDMPWVAKSADSLNFNVQAVYKQITTTTLWSGSFSKYSKFYALGVDAYNLVLGLNDLIAVPQNGLPGASGNLYLDRYNHIYRELQWFQMKNGALRQFAGEINYETSHN